MHVIWLAELAVEQCGEWCLCLCAGNAKLVSLSGAVKLAAVNNIQIPGTVIMMIRKYCKVRGGRWKKRERGGGRGEGGGRGRGRRERERGGGRGEGRGIEEEVIEGKG